ELWGGAVAAAIGGHAGASLSLSERWSVAVLAAPAWGLGRASGVRAWTLEGVALVEYSVVRHVELAFGATGRMLWASGSALVAPSGLHATTGGGCAAVRYVFDLGALRLSAGPELEALLRPIIVQVSGNEVFRLPTF